MSHNNKNIKVLTRIRALKADCKEALDLNGKTTEISFNHNGRLNHFNCDYILPTGGKQSEIFNEIIKELANGFISGDSSTVVALGQPKTGKTFTLFGNGNITDENTFGIVPRLLKYLLEKSFLVCVSFYGIQNEISDLIGNNQQSFGKNVFTKILSVEQALKILEEGLAKSKPASHNFFIIRLVDDKTDKKDGLESEITIADLSSDSCKVLKQCLYNFQAEKSEESDLLKVLQETLSVSNLYLLATICSCKKHVEKSIQTLTCALHIKTAINAKTCKKSEENSIASALNEERTLQRDLLACKTKKGILLTAAQYQDLIDDQKQLELELQNKLKKLSLMKQLKKRTEELRTAKKNRDFLVAETYKKSHLDTVLKEKKAKLVELEDSTSKFRNKMQEMAKVQVKYLQNFDKVSQSFLLGDCQFLSTEFSNSCHESNAQICKIEAFAAQFEADDLAAKELFQTLCMENLERADKVLQLEKQRKEILKKNILDFLNSQQTAIENYTKKQLILGENLKKSIVLNIEKVEKQIEELKTLQEENIDAKFVEVFRNAREKLQNLMQNFQSSLPAANFCDYPAKKQEKIEETNRSIAESFAECRKSFAEKQKATISHIKCLQDELNNIHNLYQKNMENINEDFHRNLEDTKNILKMAAKKSEFNAQENRKTIKSINELNATAVNALESNVKATNDAVASKNFQFKQLLEEEKQKEFVFTKKLQIQNILNINEKFHDDIEEVFSSVTDVIANYTSIVENNLEDLHLEAAEESKRMLRLVEEYNEYAEHLPEKLEHPKVTGKTPLSKDNKIKIVGLEKPKKVNMPILKTPPSANDSSVSLISDDDSFTDHRSRE